MLEQFFVDGSVDGSVDSFVDRFVGRTADGLVERGQTGGNNRPSGMTSATASSNKITIKTTDQLMFAPSVDQRCRRKADSDARQHR